jgi:hypothetical protein
LEQYIDGIAAHFGGMAGAIRVVAGHVRYSPDFDAPECSDACRAGWKVEPEADRGEDPPDAT